MLPDGTTASAAIIVQGKFCFKDNDNSISAQKLIVLSDITFEGVLYIILAVLALFGLISVIFVSTAGGKFICTDF